MKQLRTAVLAFLDKVDALLTTEPARMIGYGAAVVVYLVAKVLAAKGLIAEPIDFNQSLASAVAAIASLVIIVESIRRFVYSPMTYIEDLSDEAKAAHEAAHLEEDFQRLRAALRQRQVDAEAAAKAGDAPKGAVSIQTDKVQ